MLYFAIPRYLEVHKHLADSIEEKAAESSRLEIRGEGRGLGES